MKLSLKEQLQKKERSRRGASIERQCLGLSVNDYTDFRISDKKLRQNIKTRLSRLKSVSRSYSMIKSKSEKNIVRITRKA